MAGGWKRFHNEELHGLSSSLYIWNRGGSFNIVTTLGRTTGVQFSAGMLLGFFSLCYRTRTGCGVYSASCTVGTGGCDPMDKAAVA